MQHLKIFETETAFEENKATLESPCVALTEDDTEIHIVYNNEPLSSDFVDLGLPGSLKWASCNLGAENPYEFGDYYQWGDVNGYSGEGADFKVFNWPYYKYCNGSYSTMTKYCTDKAYGTVDGKSQLDAEDDAAVAAGKGRMPTATEYQILRDETIWVWSPGGKVGVKSGTSTIDYVDYPAGYFVFKVKSESDKGAMGTFTKDADGNLVGFTAQSGTVYYTGAHSVTEGAIKDGDTHIFFPASGFASGYDITMGVDGRGSDGYYWSSSLLASNSVAGHLLRFYSGDINPQGRGDRCLGFCVRSVSEK